MWLRSLFDRRTAQLPITTQLIPAVCKVQILSHSNPSLTPGQLLARNTFWNLVGLVAPMAVGLFAIPYLIEGMGKERFGLLAIIWMGVGYFSLFDIGIGRALTKLVAERLGRDQLSDLPGLVWTALYLISGLGLVGMIIVLLTAEPLIVKVLNVPVDLQAEGVMSFRLLGASLPIVIATSAVVGILEANQRFARIAAVRVPLGVMTFLGPVISLQFSPSLVGATSLLVATRVAAFAFYYASAAHVSSHLKRPSGIAIKHIRPLLTFGGWLTISTVIGPVMIYFDRFLIGSLLTLTAVAYYTTPYEVLSRIQVLPQSLFGVLFPAFAATHAADAAKLAHLYDRALYFLMLVMVPIMALLFLFAQELLQIWLGAEFSRASAGVARWLVLGWLHVIVARAHSIVLQAVGRPDLLAKAHMCELVPYLVLLWMLTSEYGIIGTAIAWFVRALMDAIALPMLTAYAVQPLSRGVRRTFGVLPLIWIGFGTLYWVESIVLKAAIAVVLVSVCVRVLIGPFRQLLLTKASAEEMQSSVTKDAFLVRDARSKSRSNETEV